MKQENTIREYTDENFNWARGKTNKLLCRIQEESDQPMQKLSLIRLFAIHMTVHMSSLQFIFHQR